METEKTRKSKTDERAEKSKWKRWLIPLIIVIIIILLLSMCGRSCMKETEEKVTRVIETVTLKNANLSEVGSSETRMRTAEELNDLVAEGMINIELNPYPVFRSGVSKGNLGIKNNLVNRYPICAEIKRNDTGEVIYESGIIPVGYEVASDYLSVRLPKGTYHCTAFISNVDENGVKTGTAGATMTITVES